MKLIITWTNGDSEFLNLDRHHFEELKEMLSKSDIENFSLSYKVQGTPDIIILNFKHARTVILREES